MVNFSLEGKVALVTGADWAAITKLCKDVLDIIKEIR